MEYATFTAALLAAVETSEPRTNALKAMTQEPRHHEDQSGRRTVTYTTPVFTLIIRKEPGAKTWTPHWVWTDTAPTGPREFKHLGIQYRVRSGRIERYDGGSLGYTPTHSLQVYAEARRLGLL